MKVEFIGLLLGATFMATPLSAQEFVLDSTDYFRNGGVDVMSFSDFYPEGHQGGVCIIMNGTRVATNGDIRLEATPGQWQPVSKLHQRKSDKANNIITARLSYPDSSRHLTGFNPMVYPDLQLDYTVNVRGDGDNIIVTVDLDRPIPEKFAGKIGFNMELFPGDLFGKPWIMDDQTGIFPQQPNGPTMTVISNKGSEGNFCSLSPESGRLANIKQLYGNNSYSPIIADDIIAAPYAEGHTFTVKPDDPYHKFKIVSAETPIKLIDGRMNHNNGWFVLRSDIPVGATKKALTWTITPEIVSDWRYPAVIQTSQIGYHPNQPKEAIIETDKRSVGNIGEAVLYCITSSGEEKVLSAVPQTWGDFLRYNYLKFDFSDVKKAGLYQIKYGDSSSSVFRIAEDVYDRGVWQPVLEYFLPVQMCHMRVNEKYRVWHGLCHMDDARMAPTLNHIDGYSQGASNFTKFKPGDVVPGLNIGGWHDAGDFDLRVESQAGEAYILALAYEAFRENYDVTSIDQRKHITEIHQPDGKPDMLQQVENGALTVVGGYKALGRLYRGIICNDLRQYVMLGDAAAMTDNVAGNADDRWVFTEDNPARELSTAASLAAMSRVLKGFNDTLSIQSLETAQELFDKTRVPDNAKMGKLQAAVELYLATGDKIYEHYLLDNKKFIVDNIGRTGWFIGRADKKLNNSDFSKTLKTALVAYNDKLQVLQKETPYGVPYKPGIWGAGWDIQRCGYEQYFLVNSYPDIFNPELLYNALNFILGAHPGSNTESFASGVGAKSATVAYGLNRADWSYIPGGVISGTAVIRPDFPELLRFPYLWQQTEYVLGGGSSHYMFLVLAAQQLLRK